MSRATGEADKRRKATLPPATTARTRLDAASSRVTARPSSNGPGVNTPSSTVPM